MMKRLLGTWSVSLALAVAASAQTPAGGEFQVNTYTTRGQIHPFAAMDADGAFVVVWTSGGQDGDSYGAFGRRFAASGEPRGSEFRINTYTTGLQWQPMVAGRSRGDFVVVWTSGADIRGRRYDSAGNAIGEELLVTSASVFQTRVGLAADGRFVVSWEGPSADGSGAGIVARRFDASGNPLGGEFVVNTYTTGYQDFGNLAVAADGSFVVAWNDHNYRDGSGSAIFAQRYDASGNRLGGEFLVNSYTTGKQYRPSVSMSPAGGFVVAWNSDSGDGTGWSRFDVFARRFDAAGNAVGSDFVVPTYTTDLQYGGFSKIAQDARGNFVVTWLAIYPPTELNLFAQRFSSSGARRGSEFKVNTYSVSFDGRPSVASDSVGNFVVAWHRLAQDQSSYEVFAQRFGGLGPAALLVDSQGNRVLEPGETVDMRPAWRNFNGAAQTFSATLTDITGPAGAIYTINDPTGDYGTVADGTTAPCADCYEVRVSNPNPRPALHWDASVVESILPDTQGQQKQWLLHLGVSFTDVPTASPFYPFIETLLHKGVTGGCGGTNYCPSAITTREQMSAFVLVAKEGAGYAPPACGTPAFGDVPASNPFCKYIEELARRGVVSGCGGGNYCPTSAVTREQMAIFVLRTLDPALNPPACGTPMFDDVPASSPFCRWVEELARRGVVTGCGGANYCPTQAVTREQMGVFISATFGLTLYGP